MTKEELLLLIKAGYTKEEITALTAEQPARAEEPKEEPKEETAPAEEKPAETPSELAELKKQFAEMSAELGNIVKGLQKANLANARQGEPNKHTVDDILKEMLNPSMGGE